MDAVQFIEDRKTRKTLAKISAPKTAVSNATVRSLGKGNIYQHTYTGYREHLGITVRSSWENNVLCVLRANGIQFEYEPKTFVFPIKRGAKAYIPDIYLPASNEYIEIKGYLDTKSKTKLKRFRKYYPQDFERMFMIISKYSNTAKYFCGEQNIPVLFYEDFAVWKDRIPAWEERGK